ncbi:MAG: 4-(cytidine 5'-diphospho)-2-C-methyl-D-erythritol kinase [Pseudolabrys sp.]
MTPTTDFAPAKINLTLRIVGRRADGYHELESLVAFADVGDRLVFTPGTATTLDVDGPFSAVCGDTADNLVLKAAAALAARVPGLKGGAFRLDKRLPVASGIGGGSSDAAAALRLLARANGIATDDPRLAEAALSVGADVPVCLAARARVMRGIGEVLDAPLALPRLPAVLVNPGIATATRDVFRAFAGMHGETTPLGDVPREGLVDFLHAHGNDLTPAAIACVPVVGEVIDVLAALPGARLARMSGSGSTCFALFDAAAAAANAADALTQAYPDWWVAAASLG